MSTTKEAKGIKIDGKDVKIPSEETLKKVIIETIQYFSKPGMSHKKSLTRSNVTTIKRFNNAYIQKPWTIFARSR